MKKYNVIVDTLSLDSIFSLAKNGLLFNKNIGFCRVTRLGKMLINVKCITGSVFSQIDQPLNSFRHNQKTLSIKREELLSLLMRQDAPDAVYDLAKVLKVSKDKVAESYIVQLWKAYYHQSEAVVRSIDESCCAIINIPLAFRNKILGDNCICYNNWIDRTRIVDRDGYIFDSQYDIGSVSITILTGLLSYIILLLILPISMIFFRSTPYVKSVAVQVLRNNIDRSKKNDLFWMNGDRMLESTLLISATKFRCFFSACNISNINISKKNIDIFSWFLNYSLVLKYLATFGTFFKVSKLLLFHRCLSVFFPHLLNFFIYRSIFQSYQTKVFVSNHSYFNSAPLFAADASDIVYVRGTWSTQTFYHPHIATSADVFFSWGGATVYSYTQSGKSNTSYVMTGFIDGKNIVFKKNKSNANKNIRIGFFDNLTSSDHSNSSKDLRDIFLLLIKLLDKYKNITVIYKSKSGDMLEIYKSKTEGELEKYIQESRFVILNGERSYSNPASEISSEFDLVVGYPISSAATESMVAGVPCIHYNPFKTYQHYWEVKFIKKPIVYSIVELEREIELFLRFGETSICHWGDLRRSVNFFDDNLATERMQFYIDKLCYSDIQTVKERVKYANSKYIDKYGVDTIVC